MKIPNFLPEKAKDFFDFLLSKKPAAIVSLALIGLTLCAVIVFAFTPVKKSAPVKTEDEILVQKSFSPAHSVTIPAGPEFPEGYALYRTPNSTWSDEEKEKWFTVPNQAVLDDLKKANDSVISDILGAAP